MPTKVSYSPRRLAAAFGCGRLAGHLRTHGGTPANVGMVFGTNTDQAVTSMVDERKYVHNPQMEYFLFNTPDLATGKPGQESVGKYTVDGIEFTVRGFMDVLYPDMVVENKTGEAADWHYIQALSYATSENKVCRILYLTRQYFVEVQPDRARLEEILRQAWKNEQSQSTKRTDLCSHCPLKSSCDKWYTRNCLAQATLDLYALNQETFLTEEEKSYVAKMLDYTKSLALKYLDPGKTYTSDVGYGISLYPKDRTEMPEKLAMTQIPSPGSTKPASKKKVKGLAATIYARRVGQNKKAGSIFESEEI